MADAPPQYVGPGAVYAGGLTCLPDIVPAYVFQQFADDDDIQAFFEAQNQYARQFLAWFATLNLPIYTGGIISGALLDWVAQGVYGMSRPSITTGAIRSIEATNDAATNTMATNSRNITSNQTLQSTTDDIFRRVITWNFYKGDGFVFCIDWLKRRIKRFVDGPDGISPTIDQTYDVGVTVAGSVFTVAVLTVTPAVVETLAALIGSGACITPFQYSFVVAAVTGLSNNGGMLQVTLPVGWPTSDPGVAGALWDAGGAVYVVPTTTPNPFATSVMYGSITASQLLALGGSNLPLIDPVNAGQLWNNAGMVCVSLG